MTKEVIKVDRLVAGNVDPQNCFGPNGEVPVKRGDEVVSPLNKVNHYTRSEGGIVVVSRDWHSDVPIEESEHFQTFGIHGVANTHGAEFLPGFELDADRDVVLSKGQDPALPGFSAFEGVADDGSTFEDLVRPNPGEVVALTIGGLATEYCDKATALDGVKISEKYAKLGGKLIVIAVIDAMRAVNVNPGDEEAALEEMRRAGVVMMTSDEIVNGALQVA